jgi:hypothetical protein
MAAATEPRVRDDRWIAGEVVAPDAARFDEAHDDVAVG